MVPPVPGRTQRPTSTPYLVAATGPACRVGFGGTVAAAPSAASVRRSRTTAAAASVAASTPVLTTGAKRRTRAPAAMRLTPAAAERIARAPVAVTLVIVTAPAAAVRTDQPAPPKAVVAAGCAGAVTGTPGTAMRAAVVCPIYAADARLAGPGHPATVPRSSMASGRVTP